MHTNALSSQTLLIKEGFYISIYAQKPNSEQNM